MPPYGEPLENHARPGATSGYSHPCPSISLVRLSLAGLLVDYYPGSDSTSPGAGISPGNPSRWCGEGATLFWRGRVNQDRETAAVQSLKQGQCHGRRQSQLKPDAAPATGNDGC